MILLGDSSLVDTKCLLYLPSDLETATLPSTLSEDESISVQYRFLETQSYAISVGLAISSFPA